MKKVRIQMNEFFYHQVPISDEDQGNMIFDKWALYFDPELSNPAGFLILYTNGKFAVLHANAIRYDFHKFDITFN